MNTRDEKILVLWKQRCAAVKAKIAAKFGKAKEHAIRIGTPFEAQIANIDAELAALGCRR